MQYQKTIQKNNAIQKKAIQNNLNEIPKTNNGVIQKKKLNKHKKYKKKIQYF
jgi:hypothetical protein